MEFGIEKFTRLEMKSDKRHVTEGDEIPNQVVIRRLGEKGTYKYLGIVEADTIKPEETKEKKGKRAYLRRAKKLHETKLYSRNLTKEIPGRSP